jgi:hypothetical protein
MIKIIALWDKTILISHIDEVPSELGEPDCKLTDPYLINKDGFLEPWMYEYTSQNIMMIHSDKIITIADPKEEILEKYNSTKK